MDGLKTGHTTKALYCLTATQKKTDMRLIAVVMGGTTTTKRNSEIVKLLNYGFNMYITKNLFEADKVVGEYKSVYTKPHQVNIVTTDSLYKTELKTVGDYEVTHELELDRIKPGIKHGETVGKLFIYIDVKDIMIYQ